MQSCLNVYGIPSHNSLYCFQETADEGNTLKRTICGEAVPYQLITPAVPSLSSISGIEPLLKTENKVN